MTVTINQATLNYAIALIPIISLCVYLVYRSKCICSTLWNYKRDILILVWVLICCSAGVYGFCVLTPDFGEKPICILVIMLLEMLIIFAICCIEEIPDEKVLADKDDTTFDDDDDYITDDSEEDEDECWKQ